MALVPFSLRNVTVICVFAVLAMGLWGSGRADEGTAAINDYRESKNEVVKVSVKQQDEYLSIAVFVRLRDGSIQNPNLFYLQGHYTLIGVRRVEKPGEIVTMTSKWTPFLFMPVSKEISDYVLLIRRATPTKTEVAGKQKSVFKWSDPVLLDIAAEAVAKTKSVSISPFDDLAEQQEPDDELLAKVQAMYEMDKAAEKKRENTPVKSTDDIPWYGK